VLLPHPDVTAYPGQYLLRYTLQAVDVLRSGDSSVTDKVAAARKLGSTRVIGRQDVVYTTERGTDEQMLEAEAEDFDRYELLPRKAKPVCLYAWQASSRACSAAYVRVFVGSLLVVMSCFSVYLPAPAAVGIIPVHSTDVCTCVFVFVSRLRTFFALCSLRLPRPLCNELCCCAAAAAAAAAGD
jgi:hypothetical protein